ncbi:MAG: hypothetical protein ACRD2J_15715 [Thermoanaerobaculia bacterium]
MRGRAAVIATAGILVLFVALRLSLVFLRPAFFDELFTLWIAAQPLPDQFRALLSDSGPPLYYALVHFAGPGDPSLTSARIVSLLFATALPVIVLAQRSWGAVRIVAALLLAVFPPHVYFAAEARAYALAGLLAGAGAVLVDRWLERESRRSLASAAVLLALAAYAHYYAVLLFALPIAAALTGWTGRRAREALAASAGAAALFIPGFWLASRQPPESIAWMGHAVEDPAPWAPLLQLSFAAPYPRLFVTPPPAWIQAIALGAVLAAAVAGLRSPRARRWGAMVVAPVLFAIAFTAAGIRVYFPMRFESVIALPLVVWLAFSLGAIRWKPLRLVLTVSFVVLGLSSSFFTMLSAVTRQENPWREAARLVRRSIPETVPVVASDYAYLELLSQRDETWDPQVVGFPPEIERHPGWVSESRAARDLSFDPAALPTPPFLWVGAAASAERAALARSVRLVPLFRSDYVIVARASEHPVDEAEERHRRETGDEERPDP